MNGSGWIRVELVTRGGGHVAWANLPPFVKLPEVVVWGERVFVHGGDHEVYIEGMAWPLLEGVEVDGAGVDRGVVGRGMELATHCESCDARGTAGSILADECGHCSAKGLVLFARITPR